MKRLRLTMFLLVFLLPRTAKSEEPAWAKTARQTHEKFIGTPGTLALFGDSITVSQAFWSPLAGELKNAPPELERALAGMKRHLKHECWRDWRGPEFGNDGGRTAAWGAGNIDQWLQKLKPEVAVFLFGTNDLPGASAEEYQKSMRTIAEQCVAKGTVPIVTTIPPRHGLAAKAREYAEAARELASEMKLPLVDYHAEILKRRPEDWDGASDKFKDYSDYEVPTLLARDGVHPSFPRKFQNDYSEEGLRSSGYTLRNYLTALKYSEVLECLATEPRKP